MRPAWLLLGFVTASCAAPNVATREGVGDGVTVAADVSAESLARDGYQIAPSRDGTFTAAWRPVAPPVPVNELFEIEVLLFDGHVEGGVSGKPLIGAKVQVSAWMPEHMHGMSRRPQAVETAPGRYLVRGMLLHMEGLWQIFVDVMASGVSARAEFTLTLK